MQTIINFVAFWYGFIIEWTYLPMAYAAAIDAGKAGYDVDTRKARANEVIGLKMLEDAMTRELRVSAVRQLTGWDIARTIHVGARAGTILRLANWDSERIQRKVLQISEKLQEEIAAGRQ